MSSRRIVVIVLVPVLLALCPRGSAPLLSQSARKPASVRVSPDTPTADADAAGERDEGRDRDQNGRAPPPKAEGPPSSAPQEAIGEKPTRQPSRQSGEPPRSDESPRDPTPRPPPRRGDVAPGASSEEEAQPEEGGLEELSRPPSLSIEDLDPRRMDLPRLLPALDLHGGDERWMRDKPLWLVREEMAGSGRPTTLFRRLLGRESSELLDVLLGRAPQDPFVEHGLAPPLLPRPLPVYRREGFIRTIRDEECNPAAGFLRPFGRW